MLTVLYDIWASLSLAVVGNAFVVVDSSMPSRTPLDLSFASCAHVIGDLPQVWPLSVLAPELLFCH